MSLFRATTVAQAKAVVALGTTGTGTAQMVGGFVALRTYGLRFTWAPIVPRLGPQNYFIAVTPNEVLAMYMTHVTNRPREISWRDQRSDVVVRELERTRFWTRIGYRSPSCPEENLLDVHRCGQKRSTLPLGSCTGTQARGRVGSVPPAVRSGQDGGFGVLRAECRGPQFGVGIVGRSEPRATRGNAASAS